MKNLLAALVLGMALPLAARGQVVERKSITLDGARRVIAGAMAEARKTGSGGVVAVVDAGGYLVSLERIDGTFAAGASVSTGKARTAVLFQKPTSFFEDLINKGRVAMTTVDFTPLRGGLPLMVDGQIVGGVGVSGAKSADQDEALAQAGAAALGNAGAAAVTFLGNERVAAAFVKGAPLLEQENYKVHASHREGPGQVEVHERDTDIIHVLRGSATLVTGGTVVAGHATAPEEVRGERIDGGQTHHIVPGDVVVIPSGVPHWFEQVEGKLDYFVVKVRN